MPESESSFRPLVIRAADEADADSVLSLFHQVVAEDRFLVSSIWDIPRSINEQKEQILIQNQQKNGCYFVAWIGSNLVGLVSLLGGILQREKHVAQLEILVHPDFRQQGIGRKLMNHVIHWAENNSHLQKISLSVFADNQVAVQLYRQLGFVQEGCCIGDFYERSGILRDRLLMAYFLRV